MCCEYYITNSSIIRQELIHLNLDEGLPFVQGNTAELEQVILNLILNALDAISPEGHIYIRTCMVKDGWALLEVADDGCGIRPENLPKLFEPFFTTKPVGSGIGIGLSTCYHIIQSHGGEINVQSTHGQGSRFTVTLPVHKQSEES